MATLDPTPYNHKVLEAAADVRVAEAKLENAATLLERRKILEPVGGVSKEDVDNAEASFQELFALLAASKAALQVAEDSLSYTEAYAPTDGVVLTRIREPGSTVDASQSIYSLSVTSPVWIRAFVSEPDLGKICYGMDAEIVTDSGRSYAGKIGFISPMAEFTPKTVETTKLRTDLVYRLRIYADNPDCYLKQGMPVTVKLKLHSIQNATSG